MVYDSSKLEAARTQWQKLSEPDEAMAFIGSLWRMHVQEKEYGRCYARALGAALPATVLSGTSFGVLRDGGDYELYLSGFVGLMVAGYGLLKAIQSSVYQQRQAREVDMALAELSDGDVKIGREDLGFLCDIYLEK
ncbi:hypothetical protein HYV86_03870 [Candidatus Woesearchaeota archaeon]|nr:hypothetical protein [Candidatus Woesearchaeota archaeon]